MTGRAHSLDRVVGLGSLARAQQGVVRRDQLADLGVTRHHVRSQVRAQRWRTVGPSVVLLHNTVPTRRQLLWIAVLHAGARALLAGWSALELAGLTGWERRAVHVLVPPGMVPTALPGVVVHQSVRVQEDVAVGCAPPRTTVARAALDAAAWAHDARSATAVVLAVRQRRLATATQMHDVLEQMPRLRRAALLRSLLSDEAAGPDSLAELDVERLVRRADLGPVTRQAVVTAEGVRRVDLLVQLPDGRELVVEVDGPHHADPRVRTQDAAKDAAAIAAGYAVLRIPAYTVRTDPGSVQAQLTAIARAARGRRAS